MQKLEQTADLFAAIKMASNLYVQAYFQLYKYMYKQQSRIAVREHASKGKGC